MSSDQTASTSVRRDPMTVDAARPPLIALVALLLIACLPCADRALAQNDRLTTLLAAAHAQIGVTRLYDGSYARIDYPHGDVPIDRGVCTDVIVRAYRGIDIDLQQRVHEDMRADFSAYPKLWGLRGTDRNIDHRRVPNLARYFERQGASLRIGTAAAEFRPGDIVTWRLPSGLPHIGLVSDQRTGERPLIVHNIGAGTQADDVLFAFEITGDFRYLPDE
jgi:uncharacterized protein YijF (DUF1287 family)